jgi:tetratricopeptide (TPR) repeat protein
MRVEFYHVDSFEAPNYEPIWRALRTLGVDAHLVAVPGPENAGSDGWFDYERLAAYYNRRDVQFNSSADFSSAAVTTQNDAILSSYRRPHFRLMYGPCIYPESWGLSEHAAAPFDFILVHGPAYVEYLSRWKRPDQLLVIGYPRFDDYFSSRIDRTFYEKLWDLRPQCPTAVYLPTWAENSSFDLFFSSIIELSERFNVIIKPHHCMRMEPHREETIRRSGIKCVDSSYDLTALYAVADLVVADVRSCTLFESVMVDKPTIGLSANSGDLNGWLISRGVSEIAQICSDPRRLGQEVERALEKDESAEARRTWSDNHVAYRDGTAALHAAQAMLEAIDFKGRTYAINRCPLSPADKSESSDKEKLAAGTSDKMPLISVVLPTYNNLAMLPAAIESLSKQTFYDFELIVVNDGSTDGTYEYLESLRSRQIRVIHQENSRLPNALNAGFDLARGKYLTWTSDDNYCSPLFLEGLAAALDADPEAGFAYSSFAWIDDLNRITGVCRDQDFSYSSLLRCNPGNASFLYRRECREQVGLYDPQLDGAEDWDMWLRIMEHFEPVYVPEILYYYRLHDRSTTATKADMVRHASQLTFEKALSRHNGMPRVESLYPSISECIDKGTARLHACLDIGVKMLASPWFNDRYGQAAVFFLDQALKLSNSPIAAANLATAYAMLGRRPEALDTAKWLHSVDHPLVRNVYSAIVNSQSTGSGANGKIPLLEMDKTQSELFRLESRRRRVAGNCAVPGAAQPVEAACCAPAEKSCGGVLSVHRLKELVGQAQREFTIGNHCAAVELLRQALALAPEDAKLLTRLATVIYGLGQAPLAREAAGRALALDGTDMETLALAARVGIVLAPRRGHGGNERQHCFR